MQSKRSALSEWLCIAGTKIGRVVFALVGTLGRKLSLVNSVTPALENLRWTGSQLSVCISDTLRVAVMASKKVVFQVRYLSGQVIMGSNGALDKVA